MNRFRMWFANLMRGRYGTDDLNRFLMMIAFVLIVVDIFIGWRLLDVITVFLLIYIYCRMFSRNFNARYLENQKFLMFKAKFKNRADSSGVKKDKTHKVMRCPGCGERLRVPKGVGKISITCPHCGTKFIKKV